jgi:broad specificity phosphatase PhoE
MAQFYLIRHGKADYTYAKATGYLAVFSNLAPLDKDYIYAVDETAKDPRLQDAEIIIASPYTRALQTASIISKKTGIDIIIEPDLMEWQEDLSYTYNSFARQDELIEEYIRGDYSHCESKPHLRNRILSVLERYKNHKKVIVVFHCMAILSIINELREVANAEIVPFEL